MIMSSVTPWIGNELKGYRIWQYRRRSHIYAHLEEKFFEYTPRELKAIKANINYPLNSEKIDYVVLKLKKRFNISPERRETRCVLLRQSDASPSFGDDSAAHQRKIAGRQAKVTALTFPL